MTDSATIRRRRLPNGVRIVTERVAGVRSCGIGLLLEVGSRHEHPAEAGLSHFVEHLLFKGTPGSSARELADRINLLGGNVNAYTTQESIVLHAKTVESKAPAALELLAEMLLTSVFDAEEIARERRVVLEEWKMIEDDPVELLLDLYLRQLWPEHVLGRPIIGERATIRQYSRKGVLDFWQREFRPERLVIALAGSFDEREVSRVIARTFGKMEAPAGDYRPAEQGTFGPAPRLHFASKPIEQVHFCLGHAAPPRNSPDRYALGMLNMVLGGGMSSRLFQEVRERRGLAYSIGSFLQPFSDAGMFAINGATSPDTLPEVLQITMREVARLVEEPVPPAELELARAQVVDALLMSLENTESRMLRLAESTAAFGRVIGVDEVIRAIERVNAAAVQRVARAWLGEQPWSVCLIGPAALRQRLAGGLFAKRLPAGREWRLMDLCRAFAAPQAPRRRPQ